MNKRGAVAITILWTYYLLLAISFSLIIIGYFSAVSDATLYKQKIQTAQISVGIDVLLMSDQDGTTLRLPKEDFSYYVSEGEVVVKDEYGYLGYYALDTHKRFDLTLDDEFVILRSAVG